MRRSRGRAALAAGTVVLLGVGLLPAVSVAGAVAAPTVDDALTLNAADLRFILRQIKIAERHAATATADNPCGTMIGTHPDQIPAGLNAHELPWGLRTVDGSCNNLLPGRERWGAADETFPRLVPRPGRRLQSPLPAAGFSCCTWLRSRMTSPRATYRSSETLPTR